MTAPRIEFDLEKIRTNTRCLVDRLEPHGISVTAVTKAVCGHSDIAKAMLKGGAIDLADARIANVERMREAGLTCPIAMVRTPMLSQIDQVVENCSLSYNTEISVVEMLAASALHHATTHDIMLMVEMGDMREGIMPGDLEALVAQVSGMPGVVLKGIGANFACLSGNAPDAVTMSDFSALVDKVEGACGLLLERVSGGNSANLPWADEVGSTGRTNNLRIGEAILLGIDPVSGDAIDGLHTDAFCLIAEVIESKAKPRKPVLPIADTVGARARPATERRNMMHSILAIGHQDTDVSGLWLPRGVVVKGATTDHLVVESPAGHLRVGSEVRLDVNYGALMRAMSAPDVVKIVRDPESLH